LLSFPLTKKGTISWCLFDLETEQSNRTGQMGNGKWEMGKRKGAEKHCPFASITLHLTTTRFLNFVKSFKSVEFFRVCLSGGCGFFLSFPSTTALSPQR
jgi:hypothetical protein